MAFSMSMAAEVPRSLAVTRAASETAREARLRGLVADHFDFVWRSARRIGLAPAAADDVTQEVFLVASRRLERIAAGSERAFLFATTRRVASTFRRSVARQREVLEAEPTAEHPTPGPEELTDQKRARELMDDILADLDDDERAAFVLYECEGLTMAEIATLLEVRPGTVASRLRRARTAFDLAVARRGARPAARGARS